MDFKEWKTDVLSSLHSQRRTEQICKQVIMFIQEFRDNSKLLGDFEGFSSDFIDDFSPDLINTILSTKPGNMSVANFVNTILIEYIKIFPEFVYSGKEKLINSIYSIINNSKQVLYKETAAAESFSFVGEDSRLYKENITEFIVSNYLKVCTEHYKDCKDFDIKNDLKIAKIVLLFKNKWDKELLLDYLDNFGKLFIGFVDKIQGKQLRDSNEKEIMVILSSMIDFLGNSQLSDALNKSRFEYCIRMLKSEFISKQYSALQTLISTKKLTKEQVDTLQEESIIDFLLQHLHTELIHGLFWLVKEMIKFNSVTEENLDKLWNACVLMHKSMREQFFREFSMIPSLLSEELSVFLWTDVANSKTLPNHAISFIGKSTKCIPEKCRDVLFERLFCVNEEQNQKSYIEEVNKIIVDFMPSDDKKIEELQKRCISLLEENKNVPTAVCCLEKLCQTANEESAKKILVTIVSNTKNLEPISIYMLELIRIIIERFDTPLTVEEFNIIKECINTALDVSPEKVEEFFAIDSVISNEIITLEMKISILQSITKKKTSNTKYIHLVFALFRFINEDKFDSQGINAETLELVGLDYLWDFAKFSMSKEVAENICKIYYLSLDENSTTKFIEKCTEDPIDESKIMLLERMMDIREGRITGRNQNRWDMNDTRVRVTVTGDFTGILLLPETIEAQDLLEIMSGILAYNKKNILMKKDGKLCSGSLTLTSRTVLYIKSTPYSKELPFNETRLPSYVLMREGLYKKILPFLMCGNKETEEMALRILNILPTAKEVIEELKEEEPNWEIIFDKSKISKLNYYLSALSNLTLVGYASDFFINNGVEYFFKDLFYDSEFCSDILVMTITSAIINANLTHCAELKRSKMLAEIPDEHVSYIFIELSKMIFNHPNSALKLFNLAISAAHVKPQILMNESFKVLLKKAVFHPDLVYRQSILKLIHFGKLVPELILSLLDLSRTINCAQYFQLLKECTPKCGTEDWERVVDFFIAQFPSTTEFCDMLQANYPPQQFVDGIIDSLLAFPKEKRTRKMELLNFILDKVLLNEVRFFQPTKSVFKLLTELSNEENIREALLSSLSKAHSAYKGTDMSKIDIGKKHRGLKNLGATCYMNAALQSLFHTQEFLDSILAADVPKDCWLFRLQLLFAFMKFLPVSLINTADFASNWRDFDGRPVNVREQQDSIEFLQTLLDRAEDKVKGITSMFQGELVNTIEGIDIEYSSESYQKFTIFPIEIQNANNISDSFEMFLTPDMLTGDNQYIVDGIGKIDAMHKHRIKKSPKILIIQLKRFAYDMRTGEWHKIGTKFVFPQDLDISPITTQTSPIENKYSLCGVILHSGTSQGGHYTTYTKTADNQWYNFNDGIVTEYHGSVVSDSCGSNGMKYESSWSSSPPSAYVLIYKQAEQNEAKEEVHKISSNVLEILKPRLFRSLRNTVLTSEEYSEFFLNVCNDGKCLFEYFTNCLTPIKGTEILEPIQRRLQVLTMDNTEFANFIVLQNETIFNCLLLSPSKEMRHSFADVLCAAMQVADKSNVDSMLEFLESKFDVIINHWRNFDEFFLPFLQSVSMSGSIEKKLIPLFFDFLQKTVPEYAEKNPSFSYSDINLSSVFKLLVVLLSSPNTRASYKEMIFSPQFLNQWFQSSRHAVAFSQLLRLFVLEDNDLSSSFFKFFSENAKSLSPAAAAGHFSVLIASHSEQTKKQIDWTVKFLKEMDEFYVKTFLSSLIEKICESHIDFTVPVIDHVNDWCNSWLLSENPELRKEVKRFVISVFDSQNVDKSIETLTEKLIEKIPEVTRATSNTKSSWAIKSSYLSLEEVLPASSFYEIIEWTAKKQCALQKITDKSKVIVQALNDHRKLKMSNNLPRDSLLRIVLLTQPKAFFKHASAKSFLSAFDDLSVKNSIETALSVIHFVEGVSTTAITKSVVFKSVLNNLICKNTSQESTDFELFLRKIINKKTSSSIAKALFTCSNYKESLKNVDNYSYNLTISLLREYPETSKVFMKQKHPEFIASFAVKNKEETRFLVLIREFIDSFKLTNEEKNDWLGRPLMKPLISFLLNDRLVDCVVDRISDNYNDVVPLLIAISRCSTSLAEKVVKSLTRHAGKLSKISPLCTQLISIVSEDAPTSSVALLSEEMKTAPEECKEMLKRTMIRLHLL